LKYSDFCRDKSSNNSALIGIIAASMSVIGVIQITNKGIFVRKLTCDLERSRINYKALFDSVYTDPNEKESNVNTLSSGGEK
jgi:hypothetical protein